MPETGVTVPSGALRDLTGTTVVVTGASSGLGRESTRALARLGARVVLAVRDPGRGEAAARDVRGTVPRADLAVERVDLADLASVRAFGERLASRRVDVLLNNAGVMMPPRREVTVDGFELQLGTNHLGHWALTALLLPALLATPGSRVVTVSSLAARDAEIDVGDLQSERSYRPSRGYGQSKLANLLFAFELDRRLRAAGADVASVAAHPGLAATNIGYTTGMPRALVRLSSYVTPSAARGAIPLVVAAAGRDVQGGRYYGPSGPGQITGSRARVVPLPAAATSRDAAERLWQVSEDLTGVAMPIPG